MQEAKHVRMLDRLYDEGDGEILKFVNSEHVFIAFSGAELQLSCAGLFRVETLAARLADILKQAWEKTRASSRLTVKASGPADKLRSLEKYLAQAGLTLQSSKVTVANAEILYYPREGRARVSISAVVTPLSAVDVPLPGAPVLKAVVVTPSVVARQEPRKVKIAIVDDSKPIRILLRKILSAVPEFEVAWEAGLPSEALRELEKIRPDVLTLDLHMPEMNGVELLKTYIGRHPVPTVVISSLSKEESPLVFEALESGAIDYVQKPSATDLRSVGEVIIEKIRAAAEAKIVHRRKAPSKPAQLISAALDRGWMVAIGASTGGTEALKDVLVELPKEIPPILIVQHIPAVFSLAFANRLNSLCPFEVKEAQDGDAVLPGRVLIAPGGSHMILNRYGVMRKVAIVNSDPVNRHRPSVDVLFDSVAESVGAKAIGIILTGMGGDGAKGLLKMREAGARTIAQDEESCVVFGMPKEAIRLGGAEKVAALGDIPRVLISLLHEQPAKAKISSAR